MTTPRVSATMLSARKHVEGRRGMPGMMPREARKPDVDERRRLIEPLRAQVLAELGKAGGEPDACPRCGGTHLACEGHDRDGSQRWACRSCGRTLSRRAMGLLGYSKLKEDVWASYVEHACAGGTLRGCARGRGACPGTSRLVRTGPSEAVGRAPAPFRRGQPSPVRSTARAPASRRPAGGPGRRRGCPGSRGARRRRARARHAGPRGVRGRRGGDLGDELCEVADRGRPTDEARGPGPGGRGRGSVRLDRRPPGPRPGAPRACVSRHDATPAREAVRGELGMADATRARPEGFLARLGGSRRGGPATTPAGSCGTSRRGGRTPTGRTPCRARRRRGATTTRGSPSRGSRSPSGPTGGMSWPCRRWSNRELANLWTPLCLHVCLQRCSSVHECPKTAPRGHFSQSVYTPLPPTAARATR